MRLKRLSEFKYLGCVVDESATDGARCLRKVVSGRKVAGVVRSFVNVRRLQCECARVVHEALSMPVLLYCSETMVGKEETSSIRAVRMDTLRGLFSIECLMHG